MQKITTLSNTSYRYDTQIHRRSTRTVMVGSIAVGSEHPVVVQSMINEDTMDIVGATAGIRRLVDNFASQIENLPIKFLSMSFDTTNWPASGLLLA